MTRTPTPKGPSRGKRPAGYSDPGASLAAENSNSGSAAASREIATGAELGAIFGLSERSIREHRAKGHVFRLGNGYDYKRSVQWMLDHERIEMLKRALNGQHPAVLSEFTAMLEYRRQIADENERLQEGIAAVLAMPDLPEAARASLVTLLPTDDAEG